MKIAILGLGGVGATVAGALNEESENLILIARGEAKKAIKERGLIVESDVLGNRTVHPSLVSDDSNEIGIVDVIFICCKTYSLESVCRQYKDIIGTDTLVIPLQNGITASKEIASYLGDKGYVADGYIYCFSNIVEPGMIKNAGQMLKMGIGFENGRRDEKAEKIVDLLNKGGLKTIYGGEAVKTELWEKYTMMCGNSCALIYFDCAVGGIQDDPAKLEFLKGIYTDIKRLANAAGVKVDENIVDKYLRVFMTNPPQSMTSMYRDIIDGRENNEFDAVAGSGYRLALELGVDVPYIKKVYEKMNKNS